MKLPPTNRQELFLDLHILTPLVYLYCWGVSAEPVNKPEWQYLNHLEYGETKQQAIARLS